MEKIIKGLLPGTNRAVPVQAAADCKAKPRPKLPQIPAEDQKSLVAQLSPLDFKQCVIVCHPQACWMHYVFAYGCRQIRQTLTCDKVGIDCERAILVVSRMRYLKCVCPISAYSLHSADCMKQPGRIPNLIIERMRTIATHGPLRHAESSEPGELIGSTLWLSFVGTLEQFTDMLPQVAEVAEELGYPMAELDFPDTTPTWFASWFEPTIAPTNGQPHRFN